MEKRIGKLVTSEELREVLDREKSREEDRKCFEAELKGIKEGECLLYEGKEGAGALGNLGLTLFVGQIKGLKIVTEGDRSYVYRENSGS